jgi:uncharacterized protein (DUF1697 family)
VPQSVAFLRAINLGSKRRVAMADLRREFEALGFDGVSTYINSGNVVFSTRRRGRALEQDIEERLEAAFGFEIPTYVRTGAELRDVLAAEPFEVRPGDTYTVAFLPKAPPAAARTAVAALSTDTDELVLIGRELHWRVAGKVMDSRIDLEDLRRAVGLPTTARNTTMLRKLVAKLD